MLNRPRLLLSVHASSPFTYVGPLRSCRSPALIHCRIFFCRQKVCRPSLKPHHPISLGEQG